MPTLLLSSFIIIILFIILTIMIHDDAYYILKLLLTLHVYIYIINVCIYYLYTCEYMYVIKKMCVVYVYRERTGFPFFGKWQIHIEVS